jgi:aminoglycoside 2'-N-acetyltransferase I
VASVRTVGSDELGQAEVTAIRDVLNAAFGDEPDEAFTEEDWDHAVGGLHFILEENGTVAAHASVVERELHTSGHRLATGYVEAVATRPYLQGRGHGSTVMRAVGEYIDGTFQLGALGGEPSFYERLGWVVWEGPTFVRTQAGLIPTPEEDGLVLVRLTPSSPEFDLSAPISCDWRLGDVW